MSVKISHARMKTVLTGCVTMLCCVMSQVLWADGANPTLGSVANQITSSFTNVTKLITAISYLAGLAFAIGAILKFKQHKDQPGQIPIGQPIGLTLIAGALIFLPSIVSTLGYTAFEQPSAAGPTGSDTVGM